LIVKFSSIGDCVMALPVPSLIRRAEPESFVVWAVDPRCAAPIWNGDTGAPVDERFEIPWERWKLEKRGTLTHLRHYLQLRKFRLDLALDLQGRAKTAICLRLCGAKVRVTARSYDPLPGLLSRVVGDLTTHHVESNLAALRAVWPLQGDVSPMVPPWASVPREPMLATISVGSGHAAKTYTRWAEVAKGLLQKGWTVEFLGGPGESAPVVTGAIDTVGKRSLQAAYARVAASQVHLAADTGSGHWAAAVGVPVVSLFGSHTNSRTFAPYAQRRSLIVSDGHPDEIDPADVVEHAERWR
jgi:ADP-heptose:LPS heptosyltransferase